MIGVTGFADCCGIKIVYAFPGGYGTDYDKQEEFISEKELNKNLYAFDWNPGLILVALASYQWKAYHDRMLKQNFTVMAQFRNPNSGNQVRLYGRLRGKQLKETKLGEI